MSVPISPAVTLPQRFARFALARMGWSLIVAAPLPRKAVLVGYPHTSNWDFLVVLLGLLALGIRPRWVGKDSLFRYGMGPLMRVLGGIPVNRRQSTGFIDRMAQIFADRSDFLLCIAPEGTRQLTEGWKTGFYHLALAAKVPMAACVMDYGRKQIGVLGLIDPSDDIQHDLGKLAALYQGCLGLRPDRASPITIRPRRG